MKENYYIGLVPEIASFVTGLEEVERLIGKGFVFHDVEIELVHLGLFQRHERECGVSSYYVEGGGDSESSPE